MAVCKYFQFNSCHFHKRCKFLHLKEWKFCSKTTCEDNYCIYLHDRPICKYYQKGNCIFSEEKCWFSHEKKPKNSLEKKAECFKSNKIFISKKRYVSREKPKKPSGRNKNFKYKKKIKQLQSELLDIKTQLRNIEEYYKNNMLTKDTVNNHPDLITSPEKEKIDNNLKLKPLVEGQAIQRDGTDLQQSRPENLRTGIPATNTCRSLNIRCTLGLKASKKEESPVGEKHQNVIPLEVPADGRCQSFSENQAELLETQNETQYFSEWEQNDTNNMLNVQQEDLPAEKNSKQVPNYVLSDLWIFEGGELRLRPGIIDC